MRKTQLILIADATSKSSFNSKQQDHQNSTSTFDVHINNNDTYLLLCSRLTEINAILVYRRSLLYINNE